VEDPEDIYERDFEEEYSEGFGEEIDSYEEEAIDSVLKLFNDNKGKVFYGRQIEVLLENQYFHWVTNRALRVLAGQKIISREVNTMAWGGSIILYWHNSFRYYKREASKVIKIVEAYSADMVSFAVGQYGELLSLEGFAKFQFVLKGRSVNEFMGKKWTASNHNLDMIIERDGIGYGVEIKNTLGYINKEEFELKIELCRFLGLKPVFVARMLPKNWMHVLIEHGGFGLLLKYQLFPPYLGTLAGQMETELGLPVKSPKSLFDGTIKRFENWHKKNVNSI
jgi:hypothetical protein